MGGYGRVLSLEKVQKGVFLDTPRPRSQGEGGSLVSTVWIQACCQGRGPIGNLLDRRCPIMGTPAGTASPGPRGRGRVEVPRGALMAPRAWMGLWLHHDVCPSSQVSGCSKLWLTYMLLATFTGDGCFEQETVLAMAASSARFCSNTRPGLASGPAEGQTEGTMVSKAASSVVQPKKFRS